MVSVRSSALPSACMLRRISDSMAWMRSSRPLQTWRLAWLARWMPVHTLPHFGRRTVHGTGGSPCASRLILRASAAMRLSSAPTVPAMVLDEPSTCPACETGPARWRGPGYQSRSRVRRRAMLWLCNWQTRLSVTPSTAAISFRFMSCS